MKLEEYQELAPKTLNDKEYQINCLHMALGMAGELEELFEASEEEDLEKMESSFGEEGGDIIWFVVVLGNIKGVKFSTAKLAVHPSQIGASDMFSIYGHLRNIVHHVLTLTDVVKREICYGKAKYQGVEITPEKYEDLMYGVIKAVEELFKDSNINIEEMYDLNIEKLHGVRYKEGFSTEAATNRNLDAEKKVIYGTDPELLDMTLTEMITPNSSDDDDEDEEQEKYTILCSDGDNDYHVPKYKSEAFHKDVRRLEELYKDNSSEDSTDYYYEACEAFDSVWGNYKI